MIRKIVLVAILTTVFILVSEKHIAQANTVTYHISVTIPAIIGLNTPPYDDDQRLTRMIQGNDKTLELFEEEVFRNDQMVLLKTYVAK